MTDKEKKPVGRPKKEESDQKRSMSIRLTAEQRARLKKMGVTRFRRMLDEMPE